MRALRARSGPLALCLGVALWRGVDAAGGETVYLFTHIPKTGGSSFITDLVRVAGPTAQGGSGVLRPCVHPLSVDLHRLLRCDSPPCKLDKASGTWRSGGRTGLQLGKLQRSWQGCNLVSTEGVFGPDSLVAVELLRRNRAPVAAGSTGG